MNRKLIYGTWNPFLRGGFPFLPGPFERGLAASAKVTYLGPSSSLTTFSFSRKQPRQFMVARTSGSTSSLVGMIDVCTTSLIGSSGSDSLDPMITHGWRPTSSNCRGEGHGVGGDGVGGERGRWVKGGGMEKKRRKTLRIIFLLESLEALFW